MSRARALLGLGAAAVAIAVVLAFCTIRVGPDEVGVRTNNVALLGWRGVVGRDFGPGWHLHLPGITTWSVLPARVRRVELTSDVRHRSGLGGEALVVQSSDGDRVILEIDVFFRILPDHAHDLVQDSGPSDAHVGILTALASEQLRVVFGALRAEQKYDPAARRDRTDAAKAAINAVLAPRSLEVVDLALQGVQFEPKYEQKIKDKKLADQNVELAKAQARAAGERAKVGAIRLETTRQVQLVKTQASADVAKIRADAAKYQAERQGAADVYRAEQTAEGTLALGAAEAEVRRARTTALSGSGGANYAALEAVKNLKLDSVQFPTSGGAWFDAQAMATQLGARR